MQLPPCLTKKPNFPQGRDKTVYNDFLNKIYADRAQLLANFGKGIFHQSISPALADWFFKIGMEASLQATAMSMIALRDRSQWSC